LLAFEGAKVKLVRSLGYPESVFNFKYDGTAFRRGLIIDKKRGNILQVDRHKYVRKAYHGMTYEIPSKERKAIYSKQVTSFTENNFVNIDTLFHPIGELAV
jgi:5'-nucleotidase